MLPLSTIAPKLHTTQMSFNRMADKYIVATHPVGTQQQEEINHCHMQQWAWFLYPLYALNIDRLRLTVSLHLPQILASENTSNDQSFISHGLMPGFGRQCRSFLRR